jgi:hypothetical protein
LKKFKSISLLVIALLIVSLIAPINGGLANSKISYKVAKELSVYMNGKKLDSQKDAPLIVNGEVNLSVRGVFYWVIE